MSALPLPPAAPSAARSASFGVAAFVLTIAITLFQTPFILGALGTARYGTWALIGEITGYYGMLDLGTRGAISHYVSRSLAASDPNAVNRYVSAGANVLLAAGLVVLVTGIGLVVAFPTLFELNGVSTIEVQSALVVTVSIVALTLPLDVASAVIVGCRRPEIGSVADTVLRLVGFGAIVLVLRAGGGLLALALIQLGTRSLSWLYMVWQAKRLVPELRVSLFRIDRSIVRELFNYGSRTVVVSVSSLVINRLDVVVIGMMLGVRLVPAYVIGQSLIGYISNFVSVITRTFTAHFSHLQQKGDDAEVVRLFLTGSRASSAVACVLAAMAIAFAAPFLTLWIGREFTTGVVGERADVIMLILLLGHLPRMLQSITTQLMFGLRAPGVLARFAVGEAVANLILSLILVKFFGLAGIAMGTVVPMLATNLYFLPRAALRRVGIDWKTYLQQGPGRGVVLGVITLLLGFGSREVFEVESWPSLVGAGTAVMVVVIAIGWRAILLDSERVSLRLRLGLRQP